MPERSQLRILQEGKDSRTGLFYGKVSLQPKDEQIDTMVKR